MNHSNHKEFFSMQLLYMDENIQELTNLYISSTPVQERKRHFFSLYVLELEEFLKENDKNCAYFSFPKVFIGTKVTVQYEEEDDTEEYFICFPEQSDPDGGCISFLSPVGRQLLLKSVGDEISLAIPTGELKVTIKEISFGGNLLNFERRTKEA